jgi:hypothetical protein
MPVLVEGSKITFSRTIMLIVAIHAQRFSASWITAKTYLGSGRRMMVAWVFPLPGAQLAIISRNLFTVGGVKFFVV